MADALPTNKEAPNFDTFPASPRSGSEDSSASPLSRTYMPGTSGSTGAVSSYNNLAIDRSVLQVRAAQVGGAVGWAVATVRRGKGKLLVMKSRGRQGIEDLSRKTNGVRSSAQDLAVTAQRRASAFAYAAQDRAAALAQNAQQRLVDLADEVGERTSDLTRLAREKATELRERTAENYHAVRLRTQAYVNENPIQALAIVAGTAVALGVTIRVVRSRNAQRI